MLDSTRLLIRKCSHCKIPYSSMSPP